MQNKLNIDWLTDRQTDRLTNWLIDWLIDWKVLKSASTTVAVVSSCLLTGACRVWRRLYPVWQWNVYRGKNARLWWNQRLRWRVGWTKLLWVTHPTTQFFFQTGCPSCRPTNSVKALKALWVIRLTWNRTNKAAQSNGYLRGSWDTRG